MVDKEETSVASKMAERGTGLGPEEPAEMEEPFEEFLPFGDDEEDEYVINPAHESDKPVKRLPLLNDAVIVLRKTNLSIIFFQ